MERGREIGAGGDLIVWHRAMDLLPAAYGVAERLPPEGRRVLGDQIRRAATSIPANIAEGNARTHRLEYVHFLYIARGSLAELATHIEVVRRVGYLNDGDLLVARQLTRSVGQLLNRLLASLSPEAT